MNALKKLLAAEQQPAPVQPEQSPEPWPEPLTDGELQIADDGTRWRVKFVEELGREVAVRVDPPSKYSGAWYDETDLWAMEKD